MQNSTTHAPTARGDAAPLLGATTTALLRALLAIVTIPLWITFGRLVTGMAWGLLKPPR